MKVRIMITGRGYDRAAGLPDELTLPEGATVADALLSLKALADDAALPAATLVAVSGRHLGTLGSHPDAELRDGDELALIAPVAGG